MSALTSPDGTEAIAAAARLARRLPSRTHQVMDSDKPVGPMAVRIGATVYPSLRKAARAHHVSIGAVQKWLDKGRAVPA